MLKPMRFALSIQDLAVFKGGLPSSFQNRQNPIEFLSSAPTLLNKLSVPNAKRQLFSELWMWRLVSPSVSFNVSKASKLHYAESCRFDRSSFIAFKTRPCALLQRDWTSAIFQQKKSSQTRAENPKDFATIAKNYLARRLAFVANNNAEKNI